ncbi:hypothetical protein HK099_001385 [Clydaea vesicula]|uniref:Cyclin N-terminal domain-containing protein n=1 Tax=Clydaea vesicula TaxID=447962 RepID=A0AAD5TUD9_9FUNG|nr:hypothetical protein HK099_001385 [Clydaea vesicula]
MNYHNPQSTSSTINPSKNLVQCINHAQNLIDLCCKVLRYYYPTIEDSHLTPLESFVTELIKATNVNFSMLQLSLIYISKLHDFQSEERKLLKQHPMFSCRRRMFLASLLISVKILQEKAPKNNCWAKTCGIPLKEINESERLVLQVLDFKLFVPAELFNYYRKRIAEL